MTEATDLQETLSHGGRIGRSFCHARRRTRTRKVRDTDGGARSGLSGQAWPNKAGWGHCFRKAKVAPGLGLRAAAIIAERLGYACHSEAFVAGAIIAVSALLACPAECPSQASAGRHRLGQTAREPGLAA